MDIFYYWKDFEADLAQRRVGWLKSERAKLGQLQERGIDHIWAFKTPRGMKGHVQLIARLLWSDTPPKGAPANGASFMFYDPDSERTVRFVGADSEEAVNEVSHVIRKRFPRMSHGNFQGDNGLQKLEIDCVRELEKCIARYGAVPLLQASDQGKRAVRVK